MKWYKIKAEYYRKKKKVLKSFNSFKTKIKSMPSLFDKRFTKFVESTGYKRRHCWPGMDGNKISFLHYKKATESVQSFCYYGPIGWLPWSRFFISKKYNRLMK